MSPCFFPPLGRLVSIRKLFKKWKWIVLVVVFSLFYIFNYKIVYSQGTSMKPTINDGALFVVKKRYYKNNPIKRFDIVVIADERQGGEYITKRVIALEGEKVEIVDGNIFVNDMLIKDRFSSSKISFLLYEGKQMNIDERPFVVPSGSIWVIGDNRASSHYGVYSCKDVIGRVGLLI